MISLKELNPHGYETTPEQAANLEKLLEVMNRVRTAWGKPMIVTSGLRSQEDQARINPKAPKSKHLLGAACDIQDVDGSLFKWCQVNEELLRSFGVSAIELGTERDDGSGWVHYQILPTPSGHFWFWP